MTIWLQPIPNKWVCAWTRVNERGTPSGRIHAVDRETGKSACGNKHAGAIQPTIFFNRLSIYGKPYDCKICTRLVNL